MARLLVLASVSENSNQRNWLTKTTSSWRVKFHFLLSVFISSLQGLCFYGNLVYIDGIVWAHVASWPDERRISSCCNWRKSARRVPTKTKCNRFSSEQLYTRQLYLINLSGVGNEQTIGTIASDIYLKWSKRE